MPSGVPRAGLRAKRACGIRYFGRVGRRWEGIWGFRTPGVWGMYPCRGAGGYVVVRTAPSGRFGIWAVHEPPLHGIVRMRISHWMERSDGAVPRADVRLHVGAIAFGRVFGWTVPFGTTRYRAKPVGRFANRPNNEPPFANRTEPPSVSANRPRHRMGAHDGDVVNGRGRT